MDELNPNEKGQEARGHAHASYLWLLGLCVGLAIGAGVGVAVGQIGAGVAIGTGAGVAAGFLFARRVGPNSKGG